MSTEQELAYWRERAAFETWFTKTKAYIDDPKHIIAQVVKDIAWEAWQAALEAAHKRGGANPTTAGNDVESGMNTGSQGGVQSASPYGGCGCNSEDCRVNGCLMKRQAQSALAPGGGGVLTELVKRKRPYAPGSALGELGVIPMCDQVDKPVKVPPGYVLIAEKYLEEMIGPERMDQLAKREL